jgi:hypothetical protein
MFLKNFWFLSNCAVLFILSGCGIPTPQLGSQLGKDAIINDANIALTNGDCTSAISSLLPLYNSTQTDNYVRLITASAYGCGAGIDFLVQLDQMVQNSASLGGTGFWRFIVEQYPSTFADTRAESAFLGFDAVQAMIGPGVIVPAAFQVNPSTYNVGSTRYTDRDGDGNAYLAFLSISALGALGNRYGAPDGAFLKTVDLPWTSAVAVDADGCSYASAVVNMLDGLHLASTVVSGSISTTLNNILSAFDTVINAACDIGCQNTAVPGWTQSGCTVTTACAQCPTALRDRSSCQGIVSDQVSCAASGIINFINEDLVAGWN